MVPDPGNPQDLNRYAYARDNPLRYTDPTGHFSPEAIQKYLQETYGDEWEEILATWMANEAWWTALLEAQPGDILAWQGEGGDFVYGLILGEMRGEGPEDDVLQGLVRLERIPRAGERLRLVSHELEDVRLWAERPVVALARLGNQGRTLAYWAPGSRKWSDQYLNFPATFVPHPKQTVHPIGKHLIASFCFVIIGEWAGWGAEALSAGGPFGIPTAIVFWGGALWLFPTAYNMTLVPSR